MQQKDSTKDHERFGELSALALVGQVSPAEYQELELHLESCAECKAEHSDFAVILSKHLPLLHQQLSPAENKRGDAGLYPRAASFEPPEDPATELDNVEVLPLPDNRGQLKGRQKLWPLFFGRIPRLAEAVSFGFLVVVVLLSFVIYRYAERDRSQVASLSRLKNEVILLRNQIVRNQPVVTPVVPTPQNDSGTDQNSRNSDLVVRASALEAQLKASSDEVRLLKNELEASRGKEEEISARASEVQEQLDKTNQELEATVQQRNQASGDIESKQQELQALNLELAVLRDSVDRDRRLLAAGRDITNLMGARNLRIVDVFDVDGKGRTRKPFGRVFFTEGKSLVFYAFDLDRVPSSAQAAAFQAWGSRGPYLPTAQSLGIFYRDDQTTNRWVLKFDDPQVLSEIDSVFVTVEPPGGSRKPTGARLMPAYLKADLNHP